MKDVLILGDLHLERLQSMFRNWQEWSFAPLQQVEKYAKKHNIKHVIQTGDLWDSSSPDQATLTLLIDFLANSKLQWYFISGNHDKSSRNKNSLTILKYLSKKQGLNNCRFFLQPGRCLVNGIPTVFLPWPHTTSKLLKGKPKLIIAHVERKGARYDNGLVVDEHDFQLGKHFWVLGHLHEWQTSKNLVFVGAPLQLRNGDSVNKYFLHLTYDKEFYYQRIPIKLPYRLLTIKVNQSNKWRRRLKNLQTTDYVRLLVNKQVILPQKYINHPQVLTVDWFGKNAKQVMQDVSLTAAVPDRQAALKIFLGKLGLSAAKQTLALQLAAKYEAAI